MDLFIIMAPVSLFFLVRNIVKFCRLPDTDYEQRHKYKLLILASFIALAICMFFCLAIFSPCFSANKRRTILGAACLTFVFGVQARQGLEPRRRRPLD